MVCIAWPCPFKLGNCHVSTTLSNDTFQNLSKMYGGHSKNKTVIYKVFHLTATIFQNTQSEYWSRLWGMCQPTANCLSWVMKNVYKSLTLCRSCPPFSCSGLQYAQPVYNRHSPTNKLPGELWTWWSRERCFRRWLQTPPSHLSSQPPCPPAQHQNLVPGLPAGDRLFGLDRVALENPLSHIHKPPMSLMLYVVPEKQREKDRGKEKGQEKRIWQRKKREGGAGQSGSKSTCWK